MRKSVKVRIIIFDILNEIHQKSKNFDDSFLHLTQNLNLNDRDRSMIFNIVLNSIRNNLFINEILNNFLNKKTSLKIKILLLSAITKLLYLDFKNYGKDVVLDWLEYIITLARNIDPNHALTIGWSKAENAHHFAEKIDLVSFHSYRSISTEKNAILQLQEKIENGWTAQQIRTSWKKDLEKYKRLRAPYLLYPL